MSMPARRTLKATVVYARPDRQWVVAVELEEGATIADALERSGLRDLCPELAQGMPDTGIFHHRLPPQTPVRDGERIEIYRPLEIDPKEARRRRARR
jgi:putative ubiquitin-RnfH superfamily antitoxin RatB of RatAB toxin-antitoxin module